MRVHQHKAGVKDQAISNNVGGNSSIIYLVVDADGNPIESIFNDSKTHDVKERRYHLFEQLNVYL